MNDQSRFKETFWFLCGAAGFVFLYILAITFLPIPKENIRFADTALSFLMGSVLGNAFGYLVNSSPNSKKLTSNPLEDEIPEDTQKID